MSTPKKNTSSKPKTRKRINKINSFQGALDFYNKTRPNVASLLEEAGGAVTELGGSPLSDNDRLGTEPPAPLEIGKDTDINQIELEEWLSENLNYYREELKTTLTIVDKSAQVVPTLLNGLLEEARLGTENLSKLLRKVQEEIKKGTQLSKKELDKIEGELEKRSRKLNFFKEEVDERFNGFRDSLIEYISNYILLTHLLKCSKLLTESSLPNTKKVLRSIINFKNPF
jgi:hypothetical protein